MKHKKQQICSLVLGNKAEWWTKNDYWFVDLTPSYLETYEESIIQTGLQEFVLNHLKYCANCSLGCAPGRNAVILGKELKGLCTTKQMLYFCDPDEAGVASIVKLLEFEQKVIESENMV